MWLIMSKKDKISASEKYKFPVYIHSHSSAIETINSHDEILKGKVLNILEANYSNMLKGVNKLKELSGDQVIIDYYNSTHEANGKRKIDDKYKDLVNKILQYRYRAEEDYTEEVKKIIRSIYNYKTKQFTDKDLNKKFIRLLDKYKPEIKKSMSRYINKKLKDRESQKDGELQKEEVIKFAQLTIEDVNNDPELRDWIVHSFEYNLSGRIFKRKDMEKVISNIENYIQLNKQALDESSKITESNYSKIRNTFLNSASNSNELSKIVSSGLLYECVLMGYLTTVDSILYNGKKISIKNIKSTGSSGHESTKDIVTIITDGIKDYEVGMSLKANISKGQAGTAFHKEVQGKQILDLDFNLQEYKELLYILGNIKALSIFAAPDSYPEVVTEEGNKIPSMDLKPAIMPNWIFDLQFKYAQMALVKGLAGQIVNSPLDSEGNFTNYPPLFLSFLEHDYWMCDILEALLSLVNSGDSLATYISYMPLDFNNEIFNVFDYPKLEELFIQKKLTERLNSSRYEDFVYGELTEEGQLNGSGNTVYKILNDISGTFNSLSLSKALFPMINCNIVISDLLGSYKGKLK